jgi:hypothetical protein
VNPPADRDNEFFAATVFEGALYWAANQQIQKTPLAGSEAFADTLPVTGSVYETASVLADASGVYVLATGLSDAENASVQLLKLREGAEEQRIDTGGTRAVLQFADDRNGVYLGTDVDRTVDGGARVERTTSVTRIDKQSHMRMTVLPETTVDIDPSDPVNLLQGGYMAVAVEGDLVFALFETPPDDKRLVRSQIHRANLTEPARVDGMPFDAENDYDKTRIRLLGVIDGAVVLLRIEYDGSRVRTSQVIVVPAGGGEPRAIASFAGEFPIAGLPFDAERVYWLNNSGRLYGLPRVALR